MLRNEIENNVMNVNVQKLLKESHKCHENF